MKKQTKSKKISGQFVQEKKALPESRAPRGPLKTVTEIPPKVVVKIGLDSGGKITKSVDGKRLVKGKLEVSGGKTVSFLSEVGGIAVAIIPDDLKYGTKKIEKWFGVAGVNSPVDFLVPKGAKDNDTYNYSVGLFAVDGKVYENDPVLIVKN
ncbi:MAG: hypothetical protein RIS24_2362 [Verrucomicrobiota bacterium]|jgi:hypothetical protein